MWRDDVSAPECDQQFLNQNQLPQNQRRLELNMRVLRNSEPCSDATPFSRFGTMMAPKPSKFVRIARASMPSSIMIRIVAISFSGALLAACAGSNRVDEVVHTWVNAPARPAAQYTARKNQSGERATREADSRTQPAAAPQQEAKKAEVQTASEE
jgi:hypothetical protein